VNQKTIYHIRNSKEYNTALINRGNIFLHISPDVQEGWNAISNRLPQKQRIYSDLAIETILCLKIFYRLPLRGTQGFATSILKLLNLELPCPHYSTLSRRAKTLNVDLDVRKTNEPIHLLVDSTGIKILGEGEWKTRQYGADKRRKWLKLHLGFDKNSGQILAAIVTDSSGGDPDHFPEILASVKGDIEKVGADGIYDSFANFALIEARGAKAIIPVRHGAVTHPKDPLASARNRVVEEMQSMYDEETGDANWKRESGYHARSRIETEMFRYKTVIGNKASFLDEDSARVEILLGCKILNRFTHLGRCQSYPVLSDAVLDNNNAMPENLVI
jgi:Transposase DDE domain